MHDPEPWSAARSTPPGHHYRRSTCDLAEGRASQWRRALLAIALPGLVAMARAQVAPMPDAPQGEGSADLLMFEDLPVVVTAARAARPINHSPVPVSVLTAADIHYSGLTSIPELLQFLPGVDMLRLDRNRYAVGIRGLHEEYSDRTIALIDGRNANSPVYGGPEFQRLPLLVEDIERIEVMRGPGGAVWGANAFNGVINIITKDPGECRGLLSRVTATEHGDAEVQLRWADKAGDLRWRLSAGYLEQKSSADALDRDDFDDGDFAQRAQVDTAFVYDLSPTSRLKAGFGYSDRDEGDFSPLGLPLGADGGHETWRAYAVLENDFGAGSHGYLQLFHNGQLTERQSVGIYHANETDLEGQLDLELSDGHQVVAGGNVRLHHIGTDPEAPGHVTMVGGNIDEYWVGAFASDRLRLGEAFTLEAQLRGDYYSETQLDWSGRLTLLHAADGADRHVSRLSVARAFRAPQPAAGRATTTFFAPNNVPLVQFVPNEDLDNETLSSIEAGHTYRFSRELRFRIDGFYHDYDDLIGYVDTPGLPTVVRAENVAGAHGAGGEFEATFSHDGLQCTAWYAYEDFGTTQPGQSVRAFEPSRNKAGTTVRMRFLDDFVCNLNYKYSSATHQAGSGGPASPTPEMHRLDVAMTWEFARGDATIGVSDVLDDTGVTIAQHPTPGLTFFVGGTLNF